MFIREINKNMDLNNAETHSNNHAAENVSLRSKEPDASSKHSAYFKSPCHLNNHKDGGISRNNIYGHSQKSAQISS